MDILISKKGDKSCFVSHEGDGKLVYIRSNGERLPLSDNITEDFDAVVRGENGLEVYGIDRESRLVHISFDGTRAFGEVLLEPRSPGSTISSVRAQDINGRIHLFYCINHTERMLVHQVADLPGEPAVIDRIGDRCLYDVLRLRHDNLYLVYMAEDALVTRIYNYSTKSFSAPVQIYSGIADAVSAIALTSTVYVAFTSRDGGRTSVYLYSTEADGVREVGMRVHPRSQVALLPEGEGVLVQWLENSMCFGVPCTPDMQKGKVRILGRCSGLVRPKSDTGRPLVGAVCVNLSGRPFGSWEDLYLPEETDDMCQWTAEDKPPEVGYFDIPEKPPVDFERELARIEASLERLVLLAEQALGNQPEENKEE